MGFQQVKSSLVGLAVNYFRSLMRIVYRYPVSNFSFRLLDQMFTDPLFNIIDLNPQLYNRARDLQKIRILRVSLFYIKEFIFTCKFSDRCVYWYSTNFLLWKIHFWNFVEFLERKLYWNRLSRIFTTIPIIIR